MEFSVIVPPLSEKKDILLQVKNILNDSSNIFDLDSEDWIRVFLQGYYIAPKELQNILINKQYFTLSEDKLEICYLGLSMFDTPEAKKIINDKFGNPDQDKTKKPQNVNQFQNVIFYTILMRRICLGIFILAVLVFGIWAIKKYKRKNKT
ncbi:MAG: hypothetical protein LBC68_10220 [Prevotellaceae bacterium]|nr:hypothetical protein [Prevotellaceae bacterium]